MVRKRKTILILGILSILIMVSVQVFIIKGIWNQKDEMFALRYTMLSQEALNFINRRLQNDGFDTVRFVLSKYSEQANKELHEIKEKKLLSDKKTEILEFFRGVLNKEQDLSGLLSAYFERRGFEKKFNFTIVINNLEMIREDTIVIYQSAGFLNRRAQPRNARTPSSDLSSKSNIPVNWFRMEDNNYRLIFEYFIDFSDKQKVILKETSAYLSMSILSIIIVVIIFLVAYRNLMEEKRLSNLKTDFINNMTHELKTPLSTITVAGKTLEMNTIRTSEEKILETARLIGKQSVHLNQLINMILEISMWERAQFQLDKKNVSIEEILNDVVDSFKSGNGNEAIINKKYNFAGVKADIDVIYFTTLINNLLSNAVKYSDRTPVIDIDGNTTDDKVYIRFSDNGIGISKADQKHIFDKFYRATTGNIHTFKGLGLGLYYVKRIAESHGGDVSVSSKPGKGSIFTVSLPI